MHTVIIPDDSGERMGYHRANITLPPDLWADLQVYLEEHDMTLSRLVQSLLSDHIRMPQNDRVVPMVQPCGVSEDRVREIVAEMIRSLQETGDDQETLPEQSPQTAPPITDPSFALSRYPDPVGLATRLDTWLSEYQISAREFSRRYGISLANKNRWVRGGGTTQATADAILAIISRPPDQNGSKP
jgi:hypothetical protein